MIKLMPDSWWALLRRRSLIANTLLLTAPIGVAGIVVDLAMYSHLDQSAMYFHLDQTVKLGDLLTALSATVAASVFLYSLHKDRQQKRKEYADRIRKASSTVIAKMERWGELTLRFFDEVQPAFVDADAALVKGEAFETVRDKLWRDLSVIRVLVSQRIVNEQIEIAYTDLLGYHPEVQDIFTGTLRELKALEIAMHDVFLESTQEDVKKLADAANRLKHISGEANRPAEVSPLFSALLGNNLRLTAYTIRNECADYIGKVITPFREELIKIIMGTDKQIMDRKISLSRAKNVLPHNLGQEMVSKVRKIKSQKTLLTIPSCMSMRSEFWLSRTNFCLHPNSNINNNPRIWRLSETDEIGE